MIQQRWAPARYQPGARYLGQQAPPAPPAPAPEPAPAAPAPAVRMANGYMPNLDAEPVRTWAVAQGVALAYGGTAALLWRKAAILDRILLGVGALVFGTAAYTSFRMAAEEFPGQNLPTRILGGVFGAADALAAVGGAVAAVKPGIIPRGTVSEVSIASSPI